MHIVKGEPEMSELNHSDLAGKRETGETKTQTHLRAGDRPSNSGPTGPRTEQGKKTSSQNAVRSGIFSRATLLKGESHSEYESLFEGLCESLKPEGRLEELLVEKLATNAWRYQRLLVADGAEIRKRSDVASDINQLRKVGPTTEMSLHLGGLVSRIDNPDVFERCLELLDELAHGIKANGFDEEQDGSLLRTIYGDRDMPHYRPTLYDEYLALLDTSRVTEEERERKGYATPEQCKQKALRTIDAEFIRLKEDQKKREPIEAERRKVELLRQNVPDSPGLDRLLRYESSLERAFDRTLTQLKRAQRMRKGQPLPPQLDVKIS